MTFYEELKTKYGINKPILLRDITYKGYSQAWIYKQLCSLCEEGRLIKFDKGVYYIPQNTVLGTSRLNPIDVIEKKYVETDNEIIGYYSGTAFLNQIGISTQVPNLIEIYTNNESSRVRDVKVGRQQVRLRKTRVSVTNKNAATLALLEMMNSSQARQLDKKQREMCEQYIRKNGIKRSDIIEYSKYFPDSVMRNLIESEVIFCVV